jgi:hypothetical protein
MVICLPQFRITNTVIPTSPLRKLELLTKVNSKLGLFHPLSIIYYLTSFLFQGSPLSVFFAPAKYWVVKIMRSYFKMVLQTIKNYKAYYSLS